VKPHSTRKAIVKKSTFHIGNTLALGTVLLFSGAAFAQDGTTGSGSIAGGNSTYSTTTRTEDDDNDQDYGWLGLLGLAGLAGLMKKPERHVVHQTNDPSRPNQPNH
jgi:MYXO-CTERM domain-containing protein